jgi:hypothetical protein
MMCDCNATKRRSSVDAQVLKSFAELGRSNFRATSIRWAQPPAKIGGLFLLLNLALSNFF